MIARLLLAGFWIAAAAAATLVYANDRKDRHEAIEFAGRYALAERRSSHVEAIGYAPSADLALEAAGDAAFADAMAPLTLDQLDAVARERWLKAAPQLDRELEDASALVLDAIALRPGWPRHRGVLGEIEFMRARRAVTLGRDREKWMEPLLSAVQASPGKENFALFAAGAVMEAWQYLMAADRSRAEPLLVAAFDDPRFVRVAYADLLMMVGRERVIRWLPELPAPLRAAMDAEVALGNVGSVSSLHTRWERAEWKARAMDLERIADRVRRGDLRSASSLAGAWVRTHGIADFDSPAGRRQLSTLLALWPGEPGAWRRDPRTAVVQFLLTGDTEDVDHAALQRAVHALSGVPDVVAARVALRAGDAYGASRIAAESDTAGAFEWTSYYVDLALLHLAANREAEARGALARISPAAREECDVAMIYRLLDRQPPPPSGELTQWSGLRLPLCIPPEAVRLHVWFDVSSAAVVSYGFDGGRSGTTTAQPGRNALTVALTKEGRHIFSLQKIAGGEVRPAGARLQ